MKNKIFITGSSGFVGRNLVKFLYPIYIIEKYFRNTLIKLDHEIIIHLAGMAHDLKYVTSSAEYYDVNTQLTKRIYDAFLTSNAKVFITLSSVKAVADKVEGELNEDVTPNPITHYGKSKLLAEQYILSKEIPEGKRVYILRPCMIHGPGNKGNLNLLYKLVAKGIPWPLGAFENKRSFCSVDNLCFIIKELIENENIPSGIFNIADDDPISTNEIIKLISVSQNKKSYILYLPKSLITVMSKVGDVLSLPLNTERLSKLTETYVVSNAKIKKVINKPFPVNSMEGLMKTFISLNK